MHLLSTGKVLLIYRSSFYPRDPLQLLLEYDDQSWDQREWTHIHQTGVFHVFLVEHDLWWAGTQQQLCPALAFSSLVNRSRVVFQLPTSSGPVDEEEVDGSLHPSGVARTIGGSVDRSDGETKRNQCADLASDRKKNTACASKKTVSLVAVEFLLDQQRSFLPSSRLQPFQDWESFGWSSPAEHQNRSHPTSSSQAVREAVRKWAELQAGQRILVTTPSVVVGYRCQVYRSEGATQWYTAVIVGLDEETGELTLTDDTVLEEHYEDPRLLQIKLLGEGVVESILRGETVGITSRRSRASSQAGKVVHSSLVSLAAPHHPATKRGSGVAAVRPGDRNDTTPKSKQKKNRQKAKGRRRSLPCAAKPTWLQ
ncbi:JmjC domain-containing Histone demethylation 2C-like protein [Daphnia magna]|uniref:JmjC domain-containing Histone demethylation 2C-like protein n=1 Tax=Daphnia magna TaxID=35525 RepID=A0A164V967_9CRUS|nr:JmjC domain-containing Histone demethylation 2C-like protein [Daphnia magna]